MTTRSDQAATRPVAILTDDELVALTGRDGLAVLPALAELTEDQVDQAVAAGRRSLIARGLLSLEGDEVEADLRHVLTLRGAATNAVAVSMFSAESHQYRYAYLIGDFVLEEAVNGDGVHVFALSRSADLLDTILDWAVHPEAVDAPDLTLTFDLARSEQPPPEVSAALGQAYLRSDVIFTGQATQPPVLLGVLSGPTGTWLAEAVHGSQQAIDLQPSSPAQVRRRLASHL